MGSAKGIERERECNDCFRCNIRWLLVVVYATICVAKMHLPNTPCTYITQYSLIELHLNQCALLFKRHLPLAEAREREREKEIAASAFSSEVEHVSRFGFDHVAKYFIAPYLYIGIWLAWVGCCCCCWFCSICSFALAFINRSTALRSIIVECG